jgi:hypothetical protein
MESMDYQDFAFFSKAIPNSMKRIIAHARSSFLGSDNLSAEGDAASWRQSEIIWLPLCGSVLLQPALRLTGNTLLVVYALAFRSRNGVTITTITTIIRPSCGIPVKKDYFSSWAQKDEESQPSTTGAHFGFPSLARKLHPSIPDH